jgi:hypothetical protein
MWRVNTGDVRAAVAASAARVLEKIVATAGVWMGIESVLEEYGKKQGNQSSQQEA